MFSSVHTVKISVDGFTNVDLRSLGGDKADKTCPLLSEVHQKLGGNKRLKYNKRL